MWLWPCLGVIWATSQETSPSVGGAKSALCGACPWGNAEDHSALRDWEPARNAEVP